MSSELDDLIDESIALELNVSDLYMLFYELFPEDKAFWWTLMLEEKSHASLLKGGKIALNDFTVFPKQLLHTNLNDLKETNRKILLLIDTFKNAPPSRYEAFKTALEMENSAAEMHFQEFMDSETDSEVVRQFQQLNQSDKNHSQRIEAYMKTRGI